MGSMVWAAEHGGSLLAVAPGLQQNKLPCPSHGFLSPAVTKLEWPKPLTILKYPDPRLRAPNAKVEVFDDSLMQLVKEMIPVMYQ